MFERLPHCLERLRLRELRPDDQDAFYAYRSDPAVARYQSWEPMTAAEAAGFLRSQAGQVGHAPGTWRQIAVAELETDMLVGDMGVYLSPDGSQAEFGLSIAAAAQGRGYGSECARGLIRLLFSATSVSEVVAGADARNLASLAVLANAGMRRVHTQEAEYKGEVCTEHLFSIRRAES